MSRAMKFEELRPESGCEDKAWFRFDDRTYSVTIDAEREEYGTQTQVELSRFPVLRETPKGAWLWTAQGKRFALMAARKKFAAPTLETALESYIARKQAQARIYEARAHRARQMIDAAKSLDVGRPRSQEYARKVLLGEVSGRFGVDAKRVFETRYWRSDLTGLLEGDPFAGEVQVIAPTRR